MLLDGGLKGLSLWLGGFLLCNGGLFLFLFGKHFIAYKNSMKNMNKEKKMQIPSSTIETFTIEETPWRMEEDTA